MKMRVFALAGGCAALRGDADFAFDDFIIVHIDGCPGAGDFHAITILEEAQIFLVKGASA